MQRTLSPEAMEALASAKWLGNVRQLRMVVRQVAALDEFTRDYLVQLLQITQGNISQAARMAKRNRTDFYKLLTKHELKPEEFKD